MRATTVSLGTFLKLRCPMNAYTTEPLGDALSLAAPILIVADSEAARRRAERTIDATGHRVAATVTVEQAPARLEIQARAAAVWLELDDDGGSAMDRLLDIVAADVANGRYGAIVAAPPQLLDAVESRVGAGEVGIVIEGSDADRAAALAI